MSTIIVKTVAAYKGHSLKENGDVNISFKFKYDQLINTIGLMQTLNNDVKVSAKVGEKPIKLGTFRIKNITIDGDGESTLKLNSLNDFVEMENLSMLITKDLFVLRFMAEIEEEDNGEE